MTAESDDKAEAKPARKSASFWHTQLDYAAKREEKWRKSGDEIQCRYMDDRDHYEGGGQFEKRINILWANTEVQKGALFSSLGKPDVRRSFPLPGKRNKIARTAALVLERALVACGNRYDPDVQLESAVEDVILPGRGQCWINYEPELTEAEDGTQSIAYQNVRFEHLEWKSFRHGNGRSWDDVAWVAREHLFTKSDLKKRWPDDAEAIPVNQVVDEEHINAEAKKDGSFKRARVWEIWYKPENIRVYVADGYQFELEREDDPYKLEGFFPCPRPVYAVKTASSLTPKPEFLQYKDQADELDRVNTRIWKLLEKLKYCGVYDGSAEDGDALKGLGSLQDGEFLPYKNFAALSTAGGLAAAFQVRDLAPLAATVQALAQRAMELIQSIYEVTGISDIMRGMGDGAKTATEQQLKAKFGSGRLQRKQKDVQRFVKALYRMKAEIIAEHFEREQLEAMTGILLPLDVERNAAKMQLAQIQQMQQQAQGMQQGGPEGAPPPQKPQMPDKEQMEDLEAKADACSWEEISAILRSDERRNYSIDIETDLTAFDDEETEKQQANEFMMTMTAWLEKAIPAIQGNPSIAPLFKELTMFYVSKFKPGRQMEESFDDAFEQVKDMPPQSDPEAEKAKMEMAMKEKELQGNMQLKQAETAMKGQELQQKMAFEREKFELEKQSKAMELEFKGQEMAFKRQEAEQQAAVSRETMAMEQQQRQAEFSDKRQMAAHELQMKEREFGLRSQESDAKRRDMDERRASDMESAKLERAEKGGTAALNARSEIEGAMRSEITDAITGALSRLADQLGEALGGVGEGMQLMAQQQAATADTLATMAGYMMAPREIERDPKTNRPIGVKVKADDLKGKLESLLAGRQRVAQEMNGRAEAFA